MHVRDDIRVVVGSDKAPELVGVGLAIGSVGPAGDLSTVVLAAIEQVEGGCG